jgi:hypothetical protein
MIFYVSLKNMEGFSWKNSKTKKINTTRGPKVEIL